MIKEIRKDTYANVMYQNKWFEIIIDGFTWYTDQIYYNDSFKISETLGGELNKPRLSNNQKSQVLNQFNDYQRLGFNSKILHLNRSGEYILD